MRELNQNDRYALTLLAIFAVWFAIFAWEPWYRSDWLLENVLVFLLVPAAILSHRVLPLSKISYTLIFIFLCWHEVGAHYTYAKVPYDDWFEAVFGTGLNAMLGWERNHFDRIVHFLWGLLMTYPVREIYLGTQGDVWDAHKDTSLAMLGSFIATCAIAGIVASLDRDFAREWTESLTVKRAEPLGEVELARLLAERENDSD